MTIVVGYIPTPEGEASLVAAVEEARRRDEPLHVVNVRASDSSEDRRYLEEPEVERLTGRLAGMGVIFEVQQLVRGKEPAEEIVGAAERLKASLIVIGIRRRRPTGKLIFGSQAQRILLDSECPVLAVKPST
ncbi:universal stress protein [Blastococcus tunisiensis]|uniref:Nucleotide-binding universal stress protein, UspA family n=1 Tax=Blastococcus tunisiensis TaxID=1798228 RepID=A0A1I1ZQG3_9ACTN|nr:universal stress protein [Blastococcus sp. DSM 46838]SFE32610.1 Nucleotide-binding universal stress protein, UspA family [Blastococcus sp. DSM 46838]